MSNSDNSSERRVTPLERQEILSNFFSDEVAQHLNTENALGLYGDGLVYSIPLGYNNLIGADPHLHIITTQAFVAAHGLEKVVSAEESETYIFMLSHETYTPDMEMKPGVQLFPLAASAAEILTYTGADGSVNFDRLEKDLSDLAGYKMPRKKVLNIATLALEMFTDAARNFGFTHRLLIEDDPATIWGKTLRVEYSLERGEIHLNKAALESSQSGFEAEKAVDKKLLELLQKHDVAFWVDILHGVDLESLGIADVQVYRQRFINRIQTINQRLAALDPTSDPDSPRLQIASFHRLGYKLEVLTPSERNALASELPAAEISDWEALADTAETDEEAGDSEAVLSEEIDPLGLLEARLRERFLERGLGANDLTFVLRGRKVILVDEDKELLPFNAAREQYVSMLINPEGEDIHAESRLVTARELRYFLKVNGIDYVEEELAQIAPDNLGEVDRVILSNLDKTGLVSWYAISRDLEKNLSSTDKYAIRHRIQVLSNSRAPITYFEDEQAGFRLKNGSRIRRVGGLEAVTKKLSQDVVADISAAVDPDKFFASSQQVDKMIVAKLNIGPTSANVELPGGSYRSLVYLSLAGGLENRSVQEFVINLTPAQTAFIQDLAKAGGYLDAPVYAHIGGTGSFEQSVYANFVAPINEQLELVGAPTELFIQNLKYGGYAFGGDTKYREKFILDWVGIHHRHLESPLTIGNTTWQVVDFASLQEKLASEGISLAFKPIDRGRHGLYQGLIVSRGNEKVLVEIPETQAQVIREFINSNSREISPFAAFEHEIRGNRKQAWTKLVAFLKEAGIISDSDFTGIGPGRAKDEVWFLPAEL